MRPVDADELVMFPYSEGPGTEEQIAEWIEQAGLSEDDTADRARGLCWMVIEGCINVVKTQPTLTPPNEWVAVEDAVPDPGARVLAANGNFVGEAYMASNGAWMRHDGFPWKVDAWMPMPDRRPPEGEEDT